MNPLGRVLDLLISYFLSGNLKLYRQTLCLLLVASAFSHANGQEVGKYERLDGHLRIYFEDGIYTPAYVFENPLTKTQVKAVFVHHVGEGPYFSNVKEQLADCEVVIFEDSPSSTLSPTPEMLGNARTQVEIRNKRITDHQWVDMASRSKAGLYQEYVRSMYAAYLLCAKCVRCEFEADAFSQDRESDHWISGDGQYFERLEKDAKIQRANKARLAALLKKTEKIYGLTLAKRVWDLKAQGRAADAVMREGVGEFTNTSFAAVPYNAYDAKEAFAIYSEMYLQPIADTMFREVFDARLKADSPLRKVGIKYGVEHAAYMISLLEERGFELQETVWLKSMPLLP